MANSGEVSVALNLDDADFLAGLEAARTSLEAFSREVARLSQPPELTAVEELSVPDAGAAFAEAGTQAGTAFNEALAAALSTDAFAVAARHIADAFSAVPIADQLSASLQGAAAAVDANLSSASARLAEFAGALAQSLAEAGTEAGTALADALTVSLADAPAQLAQTGARGAQALSEGLALGSPQVSSAASTLMQAALRAAGASASAANGIGVSFASGLAGGIRAGRSGVISAAVAVAQAAANAARSTLAIHSPSRVTEELGRFFDLGFIEGVRDKLPEIDRSVRAAVQLPPPPPGTVIDATTNIVPARPAAVSIDYNALAEAMMQYQPVLVMNSRRVAEIQTNDTARTQSRRARRVALGYGK